MDWNEYNVLFHKEGLNKIAFKRLMYCDKELIRFINTILEQERKEAAEHYLKLIRDCVATEREQCAQVCEEMYEEDTNAWGCAEAIRARGKE